MNYVFFLGGYDLEMITIRHILETKNQRFFDKKLSWGARASDYRDGLDSILGSEVIPVTIELTIDIALPTGTIIVDHHNERSGEEASIIQVLKLLRLEPTREHQLIAANDRGHIPAMRDEAATSEEIADIRQRDRAAQGITPAMEECAKASIANRREVNGVIIVSFPYDKPSPITDRMYDHWNGGRENLIVVCNDGQAENTVFYFGHGDICREIKTRWNGFGGGKGFGDPQQNAFAGCKTNTPHTIIEFVVNR
jgi:hypothetical protein